MLWPWFRCEPKICRACSPNHYTALPKSFLWPVEALYNMATAYLSSLIPSLTISLPDLTGLCGASRPFSLIFSRTPHHGSYILLLSPHLIHPSRIHLDIASSVGSSHYSPNIKHGWWGGWCLFPVSVLIVTRLSSSLACRFLEGVHSLLTASSDKTCRRVNTRK